jgi:hypothetical protein
MTHMKMTHLIVISLGKLNSESDPSNQGMTYFSLQWRMSQSNSSRRIKLDATVRVLLRLKE